MNGLIEQSIFLNFSTSSWGEDTTSFNFPISFATTEYHILGRPLVEAQVSDRNTAFYITSKNVNKIDVKLWNTKMSTARGSSLTIRGY